MLHLSNEVLEKNLKSLTLNERTNNLLITPKRWLNHIIKFLVLNCVISDLYIFQETVLLNLFSSFLKI